MQHLGLLETAMVGRLLPGELPINPLNAKLNPIYHFLALLGAHPIPLTLAG